MIVSGCNATPQPCFYTNLNSLLQLLRLRISRRMAYRTQSYPCGAAHKAHRNQVYFWNKSVDQHQVYDVINLKLLACYYCKNGSDYGYCSEADAYYNPPHPARHIGIKACQILLLSPAVGAVLSATSSSIASVIAISAMLITYSSVILMCSRGTLSFSMAVRYSL